MHTTEPRRDSPTLMLLRQPARGIDELLRSVMRRQPTRDPQSSDEDREFSGIRCPHCKWQPTRTSRWYCDGARSPEAPFLGCGTGWNTFETHGRCPGCSHQWRWTSCLRCSGWSLHEDWYVQDAAP